MKPNKWKAIDISGNIVEGYPICVPRVECKTYEEPPCYRTEIVEQWYMMVCDIADINQIAMSGFGVTMYSPKQIRILEDTLVEINGEDDND